MTPQKINGALSAWDGRAGEISVIQSKVFSTMSKVFLSAWEPQTYGVPVFTKKIFVLKEVVKK
jgi:hypothetical protein